MFTLRIEHRVPSFEGWKGGAILWAVAFVVAPGGAAAQRGHPLGFVVTHSVSSRTSAPAPLFTADVLAPLTLSTLEVELTVPLGRRSSWGFEYPLRAVPVAFARHNPTDSAVQMGGGWYMPLSTPRQPDLGAGVKPLGLRGWVGSGPVRLEGEVSAGVLFFASPMLAANATHLNFVAEADVGVRLRLHDGRRLALGYRRHHLSNGGRGEVNPGLNSHVVYVGLWLD